MTRRTAVSLRDSLTENFSISPIKSIGDTQMGSGNTYLVSTETGQYMAKLGERMDFLRIYEKSAQALTRKGFCVGRIVKTRRNELCTNDGVTLYEYIEGDCHSTLDKVQTEKAIHYVKAFNKALGTVPFLPDEIENKTVWDHAKSVDFLSGPFMKTFLPSFDGEGKAELIAAIHKLQKNRDMLDAQSHQLIHSDLGADNFVFSGNEVVSIIDFTPEYANEWYAICQFLYWNLLWQKARVAWPEIEETLDAYGSGYAREAVALLLLKAAVYRVAAPIMDAVDRGTLDGLNLGKRMHILSNVLSLQAELD